MRPTDRDFIVSTLSVLHEHRRNVLSILDDMSLRLEELEDQLIFSMDQKESNAYDTLIENAWLNGRNFAEAEWENDDIIYDSSRKKECMCDDCWGVTKPTDFYEHRMD
jgi:hypothetical protein